MTGHPAVLLLPLFAPLLLDSCAGGPDGPATGGCLEVFADRGPVKGFVQTPKGGQPGTSSPGRPTLDELGIQDAATEGFAASGFRGADEIRLEGWRTGLSGSGHLESDLVSHGETFPAGAEVHGTVDTDEVRLGYGRRIGLGRAGEKPIDLVPVAGIAWWRFDYALSSPGLPDTSRGYGHAAPFLGARLEWNPLGAFTLSASAEPTIPVGSSPFLLPMEIEAGLRLGAGVSATLGIRYEHTDFRDRQEFPNHVRFDRGPSLALGLRFDF